MICAAAFFGIETLLVKALLKRSPVKSKSHEASMCDDYHCIGTVSDCIVPHVRWERTAASAASEVELQPDGIVGKASTDFKCADSGVARARKATRLQVSRQPAAADRQRSTLPAVRIYGTRRCACAIAILVAAECRPCTPQRLQSTGHEPVSFAPSLALRTHLNTVYH